jgi:hypothetical protein
MTMSDDQVIAKAEEYYKAAWGVDKIVNVTGCLDDEEDKMCKRLYEELAEWHKTNRWVIGPDGYAFVEKK